jgi:hypothetical protein
MLHFQIRVATAVSQLSPKTEHHRTKQTTQNMKFDIEETCNDIGLFKKYFPIARGS